MLNQSLLQETVDKFGLKIDAETFKRLDTYAELLVETNKQFNLTAITEPDDVTIKHFADSLSIFKYVDFKNGAKGIDVGTGAGFPGLVMLLYRPDLQMTFLDGTAKRLHFIETVLEKTGVKGEILHSRAEDAGKNPMYREKFDFATARAMANLTTLSEYCMPFVKKGGAFISMKSASAEEEIESAKNAVKILGGEIKENYVFDLVEETKRRILVLKKISQTPAKYPRPSAKISKNPIR